MKIAFVGIKRKYQELSFDYRDFYNQYHLELPYYYARYGPNDIDIVTTDYSNDGIVFNTGGSLSCITENQFVEDDYDVVIHWRKWFPDLYKANAINVINSQDHSFSSEWINDVLNAYKLNKLHGILCFPTWHKENLKNELFGMIDESRLISGLTLGVDTDIYRPIAEKDPAELLWASDPGRGLKNCVEFFLKLWQKDRKYRLNICYPDYVKEKISIAHPAIRVLGCVKNGQELWNLFNRCSVLPYTSTFKEPSSRAHRQSMAAGSVVFYPKDMGTPSFLIEDGRTGFVRDPETWVNLFLESANNGIFEIISKNARDFAVSENWSVQAQRFTNFFQGLLDGKR